MSCFNKVTHVIFDMDGVLLDTETLHEKAINNVLKEFGKHLTVDVKLETMGRVAAEGSKKLVEMLNLPITAEEYQQLAVKEYSKVLENVQLMPGVEKVVKHLHQCKIPIAIATSSGLEGFKIKSRKYEEFFGYFSHIVCGGSDPEVKAGKPEPDVFLLAAARFPDKPKPEQCLVIEDSPNGVQAALKANMQVVMIPNKDIFDLVGENATLKVRTFSEIDWQCFGLPKLIE